MSLVHAALRKRFAAPEWAYFEEVRNGTGYARRTTRTADALAFSLWPSRGLELHGVEVKVHRGDWLREKDDPEKAEEIGRFCERWWLATAAGVVADVSEVPQSWGWLELSGKRLVQRKEAPLRQAQPLDKLMVAAILRNASEAMSGQIAQHVAKRLAVEMEEERETHTAELEKERSRRAFEEEQSRKQSAVLSRISNCVGFEVFDPYRLPEAMPAGAAEKLSALAGRDLAEARSAAVAAAQQLQRAASAARWMLRRAGVRVPAKRPYGGGW